MLHALRDCPKARDVLIAASFDNRLLINQYEFCIDWIEDFKHILDKKSLRRLHFYSVPKSCKWEKLSEGVTKVNVDASANALGIIARDYDGFVLSSKAVFINRVVNSKWAELDALIEGFWLAHSLNSDKVIFETDYASIVNRFRKHKEDIKILGHRIKEACKMLDSFSKADVNLVDRGCNKLADSLCTWSLSNCCNLSFKMDYPSDIHNIVIFDAI
ncbi:hypothetical protein Gohar_003031 [Gossypium harknessii]|uniref:RNase H type-1 domain-containing protein n=1 Tax=Gossypium harknessii TaxID=34285 RepID=A0A7J9HMN5_9ROSI|nr:hypothetical protein [Gossypium harknessii]